MPAKASSKVRYCSLSAPAQSQQQPQPHHLRQPFADQVSAHRPLELTRMAVHGACGREMATALREYRVWADRNRNRDSGAPKTTPDATKQPTAITAAAAAAAGGGGGGKGKRAREAASRERVAELRRMPAGWRTLRWVMMKRQGELKSQAAETAAMHSEEMEQRLKER